ncbi:hypothetical protein RCS94_07210 [Orbaceae bacterium ac157xtp]
MIVPSSYGALSATSANTIQGSKPTFTNTSGANRFGFEVGGISYSEANPVLGGSNTTKDKIVSGVTKEFDAGLKLSDFHITNLGVSDFNVSTDYYDSDGDDAHPITPFSMGAMTAQWYESNDAPITDMNQTLGCGSNLRLPLKLKIEIPNVKVRSMYGDPMDSGIITLTKVYQIGTSSGICYVRPNQMIVKPEMTWLGKKSNGTLEWNLVNPVIDPVVGGGYSSDFVFISNGLDIYGREKVIDGGFKANANPKFPTTGFPGAQFYLVMTSNAMDYTFSHNGGLAVTIETNGKVTLNSKPTAPVTITAKLNNSNPVIKHKYTFDPRSVWLVPKLNPSSSPYVNGRYKYAEAKTVCGGESNIPTRAHLTNSPQKTATASTLQYESGFTRSIGGGILSEWGSLYNFNYPNSLWYSNWDYYWTRDLAISNSSDDYMFLVGSAMGNLYSYGAKDRNYLACLE